MSPASDECANPLFRQWVGEWMEEARKMQNKSYYTYKKVFLCPDLAWAIVAYCDVGIRIAFTVPTGTRARIGSRKIERDR